MSTNVVSEEPSRSRFKQLTAELTEAIEQLQAEGDQLRERVAQLEAECRRLSSERSMLLHAWADTQYTEEELQQRAKEPGGCSLAEIMERLEKL